MNALLHSHHWYIRVARILLLAAVGWVIIKGYVFAQSQSVKRWSSEWPKTEFSVTSIDLGEILSGGPPKDGIPAIDNPTFVSSREAQQWLDPLEPVIAVNIGGTARAYPIQILMWHEIVNDTLAGTPLSVTFCPLCNASLVFDRRVDDKLIDFGTTGKLRKSDLVMYDRQTESWWQQFTGEGIVGEMTGVKLKRIPAQIIAYEDFVKAFPAGDVLSHDTGFSRAYGRNPYSGYDRIGQNPFLYDGEVDKRLPAMERVINITVNNADKIYPFSAFDEKPVINDIVNETSVVLFSRKGTYSALDKGVIAESRKVPSVTAFERRLAERELNFTAQDGAIVDEETGSSWNLFGQAIDGPLKGESLVPADSGVHFAFAWLAFNPDSEIFSAK
ncbi:MAG: DUF3179 domain-containing protein [Gammaproteobacteria bacterium]|nr:DUF3179 domain-containing protein [Gammaproteobacteria bacterium]